MKLKNYVMAFVAILSATVAFAQEAWGPLATGRTETVIRVPSLASRSILIPDEDKGGEARDKRSINPVIVIGKDKQTEDDYFVRNRHPKEGSVRSLPPDLVFDVYSSNSQPTDPAIAVGPNHVFAVWNTAFRIFNKDGSPATNQLGVTNIFSGGGCCDLTASYDQEADRWVLSYLFFSGQVQVAVSTGPDPVNDDWNVYTVPGVQDYNKLSVGPGGYYITANTGPQRVWALNRAEMVLGNSSAGFQTFNIPGFQNGPLFNAPQVANVSDSNMPDGPATLIYYADDAWAGVSDDHAKVWTLDVDFDDPSNSSISNDTEIALTDFIATFDGGGFSNLAQPGGGSSIDAIQNTVMNQAQVRKFATHNSLIFNFVVDTDAGAGKLAGIRWVELRQANDTAPWTLHQEGTYTSPDGKHAWMGSMIMDSERNIALGYTGMSGPTTGTVVRASSFYTGHMAGDPLGTMTMAEEEIRLGSGNIPGIRYGDYAKMDIDPNGDLDFWFITELNSSGRKGVAGKFTFTAPGTRNITDIGVIDITAPSDQGPLTTADDVTVLIHNFGTEAVTNPEVQYVLDGGTAVVENYSGTIQPGDTESFTFSQTANMVSTNEFLLEATSNLSDDVNTNNDTRRRYPGTLGIDTPIDESKIIITTLPNKVFEVQLNTSFADLITISVFNAAGQQVAFNNIAKEGNSYKYTLDMSYAAAGVYLVKMGDPVSGAFQTGKIIVK